MKEIDRLNGGHTRQAEEMEYDPERKLWRPGRRTFLFMLGGALAGTILKPGPELVRGVDLAGGPDYTSVSAFYRELRRVYPPARLAELMDRGAPFRRALAHSKIVNLTDVVIGGPDD
jgi:hypothetical protein